MLRASLPTCLPAIPSGVDIEGAGDSVIMSIYIGRVLYRVLSILYSRILYRSSNLYSRGSIRRRGFGWTFRPCTSGIRGKGEKKERWARKCQSSGGVIFTRGKTPWKSLSFLPGVNRSGRIRAIEKVLENTKTDFVF